MKCQLIIFMVYRRNGGTGQRLSQQNRLLVPMSVFDIIGSVALALSTTPIPKGSLCTFGAMGSKGTCITQGFMITLGLCVPFYNAMLCIYYLLIVKYNKKDHMIAKYEPYMHFVSISVPLIVAVIGLTKNLFNNDSILCWFADEDTFTIDREDTMSNVFLTSIYLASFAFFGVILLVIIYCMTNIYLFMKTLEVNMDAYRFPRSVQSLVSRQNNRSSRTSNTRHSNKLQDTKKQATLYVGSFVLTYFFTIILMTLDIFELPTPYPILLMQGIFHPLQGFWNFFAYIRPRYIIVRTQHNNKNFFQHLIITILTKPSDDANQSGRHSRNSLRKRWKESSIKNKVSVSGTCSNAINHDNIEEGQGKIDQQSSSSAEDIDTDNNLHEDSSHDDSLYYGDSLHEDFRHAVSLSILVAQDKIPPSSWRDDENRRRMSMIDRLPDNYLEGNLLSGADSFDADNDENVVSNDTQSLSLEGMKFHENQKHRASRRRHSCPTILDIKNPEE